MYFRIFSKIDKNGLKTIQLTDGIMPILTLGDLMYVEQLQHDFNRAMQMGKILLLMLICGRGKKS